MITIMFAAIVVGLLVWEFRTRKYTQALLAIASLGGIYCCIIGGWAIHQDKLWFGVTLLAVGLAALVGAAMAMKRLRSQTAKTDA